MLTLCAGYLDVVLPVQDRVPPLGEGGAGGWGVREAAQNVSDVPVGQKDRSTSPPQVIRVTRVKSFQKAPKAEICNTSTHDVMILQIKQTVSANKEKPQSRSTNISCYVRLAQQTAWIRVDLH